MNQEIILLSITAAAIGLLHTLLGPDHYLPFIVMSKARGWSLRKTSLVTLACGVGHIMSSVVLGLVGVAFGVAVFKLEAFEASRGNLAGWVLIAFGLLYFVWGLRKAIQNRPHTHLHLHDGLAHVHGHTHAKEHSHVHGADSRNVTPWILFTIFVLGPCEPLIPILMYPAAKSSMLGLIIVTAVFGLTTIATMMAVVVVSSYGLNLLPLKKLERFSHALAGGAIAASGMAIQFLGL